MSTEPADQRPENGYFEEKGNSYAIISSNIKSDSCVLVLGPLFGINQNRTEISREIKGFIKEQDGSLEFDDEFQNLFLVEKMANYGAVIIEEMIGSAYDRFLQEDVCHESYDKIASIKFNAVINFSQDTFLNNAFIKTGVNYQFTYFSICKTLEEYELLSKEPEYKTAPFIYNMFGHYQHKASLIYNYDRFYKFFFSMLGEKNVFPKEVVNRLSKGRIFILLGFDLKKWYVPIFITKLFKIGRENSLGSRPTVLAALNDTDKGNKPYVSWLTRYPLELEFIKNSYSFIDHLAGMPANLIGSNHTAPRPAELPANNDDLTEAEKAEFRSRITEIYVINEILLVINELKTIYDKKKNTEASNCMIGFTGTLKRSQNRYFSQQTGKDEMDQAFETAKQNLLVFLN